MKFAHRFFFLITTVLILSCSGDEELSMMPESPLSNDKEVIELTFESNGIGYETTINSTNISLTNELPFDTKEIEVQSTEVSPQASSSLTEGDVVNIASGSYQFEVKAENNSSAIYTVSASFEERGFDVQAFDPVAVSKSNNLPTYAHYMPWFATESHSGVWNHWGDEPEKWGAIIA